MKFKYGKTTIAFIPPQQVAWQVLTKSANGPKVDESQIVQNAVASLMTQLDERHISRESKILFIIPDHTRRCRLEVILPILAPELESRFSAHVEMLVANGNHVLQPDSVLRDLVGDDIWHNYPIHQHNAKDEAALSFFGETSMGTPVWLNRMVGEADFIITVGGVLYHYFAGFGGGPKMLLPGVAGYETIRTNHRRTIDETTGQFHSQCFEGNIKTNPVFLDLKEVVKFVTNVLSLQIVLSIDGKIVDAMAGEILPVHQQVCEKVKDIYSIPIKDKADVVVASAGGFPADVNLIQSHKSIHHAFQAVKESGWMIVLAECAEGIGSETFLPYFDEPTSSHIAQRLFQDYQINGHTALTLKSKAERANIVLVSNLQPELVEKIGMIPAPSLDAAWRMIEPRLQGTFHGYLMPSASIFVPYPE